MERPPFSLERTPPSSMERPLSTSVGLKILSEIQGIKSALNNTNSKLSSILNLDQGAFKGINEQLRKISIQGENSLKSSENAQLKMNSLEKQVENSLKSTEKIQLKINSVENQLEILPQKVTNKIKTEVPLCKPLLETPGSEKPLDDFDFEKILDFLKSKKWLAMVCAFCTFENFTQVIIIGCGGGVFYSVCTHVYIESNNPWVKLAARLGRRTASLCYPFAILGMACNLVYNVVLNKPLLQKWHFIQALKNKTTQYAFPTPFSNQAGLVCLNSLNTCLTGFAVYSVWRAYVFFENVPYFRVKFVLTCLVGQWVYGLYENWIRSNYEAPVYKKIQSLNREDFILNIFKTPAILLEDFTYESVGGVFSFIKLGVSFVGRVLKNSVPFYLTFENLQHSTAQMDEAIWDVNVLDVDFIILDSSQES